MKQSCDLSCRPPRDRHYQHQMSYWKREIKDLGSSSYTIIIHQFKYSESMEEEQL